MGREGSKPSVRLLPHGLMSGRVFPAVFHESSVPLEAPHEVELGNAGQSDEGAGKWELGPTDLCFWCNSFLFSASLTLGF